MASLAGRSDYGIDVAPGLVGSRRDEDRARAHRAHDAFRLARMILTILSPLVVLAALVWLWTSDVSQMGVNIIAVIVGCVTPMVVACMWEGEL